ncbi:MAG TPA: GNAT family N-acetyltransferase [Gaiellaceae bacterium]|nr:GNAT family N-acetyltransferase [Gaiellaceae bacterium]
MDEIQGDEAQHDEPAAAARDEGLLELAEEPGLWLPYEPKLNVFRAENFAFVTYGRSAWVHRLRLGEANLAAIVDRVEGMIALKGLDEATWWVGELSTPEGLADELAGLGLQPDDPPEMTSLTIGSAPSGEPAVDVRRAETVEDALAAAEIDWECFGVPEAERAARRQEVAAAWPALHAGGLQSTYLAYLDGEPAGFARAVFTQRAALLLGGATLPSARGHGVYTSLVHARWNEAVERGTPRLAVSAGPMSAPILESLGFDPIGRVRLLRQRL